MEAGTTFFLEKTTGFCLGRRRLQYAENQTDIAVLSLIGIGADEQSPELADDGGEAREGSAGVKSCRKNTPGMAISNGDTRFVPPHPET